MNDDCLKLTAYFAERQRADGRFFAEARERGLVTSETVPAVVLVDGDERIGGTGLAEHRY